MIRTLKMNSHTSFRAIHLMTKVTSVLTSTVNTQYVIAQNTRAFYRRVNTRNIRIFIRIYHKKPATFLITGFNNYLSYSKAFFGWSFSGEDTSSFSPLENLRYTFFICVRYCATFGYLVASSNSLTFVALLS